MPSKDAHLALANKNQTTIDYLMAKEGEHSEWIVTIAFYKALHLVEALFAQDGNLHGQNHETRDEMLKRNRRYNHIYKHYRPLWAASMVARYLMDVNARPKAYFSKFSDYLASPDVKAKILNHRLKQVEDSVRNMLKP